MNDCTNNPSSKCYYENEGKTVAQVRREIGRTIVEAVKTKRPILHISHTDLDGYGCSRLMDVIPQYLFPVTAYKYIHQCGNTNYNSENINITHYNTNKLNDALFDVLDPLAYGFHAGAWKSWSEHKKEGEDWIRPLLIITDISGFDLEQLIMVYGVEYDIIVIDHHQWTPELRTSEYYEDVNSRTSISEALITWRSWDLSGCTDKRIEVAATASRYDPKLTRKQDDTRVYVYICSDHSATKLLMDILADTISVRLKRQYNNSARKGYDRVGEFTWCEYNLKTLQTVADLVSAYDTGDFGDWYITEEGDGRLSLQTALNELIRNVSSTKSIHSSKGYSSWTEMANHIKYSQLNIFAQISYLIRYAWSTNTNDLAIDPAADRNYTASCEELMQKVQDKFTWISREYDTWASTLVPFRIGTLVVSFEPGVLEDGYAGLTMEHTECEKSYTDRIKQYVSRMNNLALGRYMIRIASEDEDYPMSIYAQKMLKDSPEVDYFMEIKEKGDKVIVSLRSVKEEANCVEIANANHGGGHIHAAGFTLK